MAAHLSPPREITMMTKTFWITLATTAAVPAVALVLQSSRNSGLARQLEAERVALIGIERDVTNLETAVPDSPLLRGLAPRPGSREEAIAEDRAHTTSAERVKRARGGLDTLVADMEDLDRSPAAFFRMLPDMLRVIEDLSIDELMAVADGIKGESSGVTDSPLGVARMILYLLAAEQDPLRVLAKKDLMDDQDMRQGLLNALSRRDPEAALRWMKSSDLTEREKQEFTSMMALRVMRDDIAKGLKLLREGTVGTRMNFAGMGAVSFAPEKLPELVAAMRQPENADFRQDILKITMTTALLEGGVAAARSRVDELGITREEVADFMGLGVMVGDPHPQEALAWMHEVQTPEQWGQALPNAIGQWAQRDYNAAGQWLGTLEASPEKDIAIQRYVQTISNVDPQAAVVWADSIAGEGARAVSLTFAADQWLQKDKPAAEVWMAEKAIDLTALRERAGGAGNPAVGPQTTLGAKVRVGTR